MFTLLYIEDEALQAESTKRLYEMCNKCFHGGVTFLTANRWDSGLVLMRSGTIDVVILDLTLPPMSKEETLSSLRSETGLPPVVIFTGNEIDDTLRRQSILAGADDFVLKSEMHRHPEILCERVYIAYLRRNRERLNQEEYATA